LWLGAVLFLETWLRVGNSLLNNNVIPSSLNYWICATIDIYPQKIYMDLESLLIHGEFLLLFALSSIGSKLWVFLKLVFNLEAIKK